MVLMNRKCHCANNSYLPEYGNTRCIHKQWIRYQYTWTCEVYERYARFVSKGEREREHESKREMERECAQRNEHWKQNSTHRAYANKHSNKQTPKQSKIIPTHFNLLIQFSVCSTRSCSHKTNIGWMHARLIVTITIHKNTPLIKPLERLANLTLF